MSDKHTFPPVLILCGGLATRLGERTKSTPKAMLQIAGRPFIDHQLRLLKRQGVSRVVMCVGYLHDQLEQYVGDGSGFGLDVRYSTDGPTLLGTGGAVQKASHLVEDEFAILYGDSYLDIDFSPIYARFIESGKLGLMTVFANHDQWDKSNVVFRNDCVELYDKHRQLPEMRYIDYGLTILRKRALHTHPEGKSFDLAETLNLISRDGQLAGYEVFKRFYEIGSAAGIRDMEEYLKQSHKS